MPITLEKLFSPTATVSLPFLGETVNVTWAPFRYTGEMQEFADALRASSAETQEELDALRLQVEDAHAAGDTELEATLEGRIELGTAKLNVAAMASLREILSKLLVFWDVMDGTTPLKTDLATLKKLPDPFLQVVFVSLTQENTPDPQSAPISDEPSSTEATSAPSPSGTSTSEPRVRSASRRSSSTNGRIEPGTIPSGVSGV